MIDAAKPAMKTAAKRAPRTPRPRKMDAVDEALAEQETLPVLLSSIDVGLVLEGFALIDETDKRLADAHRGLILRVREGLTSGRRFVIRS